MRSEIRSLKVLLLIVFIVMKGYYNMPEKTAETIDADRWLHTGDLATMNAQGYVNIVGRVKDMFSMPSC